jgi:hypothetical protein
MNPQRMNIREELGTQKLSVQGREKYGNSCIGDLKIPSG